MEDDLMLKNIKVDIIYYLISSDFEMEFNLCGCCRMRLLTDKATDKKSFVGMLARAVSRSRVIIGCGALFGDNGLISTVASAIAKPLTAADNAAYGIKTDDKINIIKGSTPLVTPDGLFGGCIIESGPQTIILLSESKSIRKIVMKNLIHPYIEQMSMLPEGGASVQSVAKQPDTPDEQSAAGVVAPEETAEPEIQDGNPDTALTADPLISEPEVTEQSDAEHALTEAEEEDSFTDGEPMFIPVSESLPDETEEQVSKSDAPQAEESADSNSTAPVELPPLVAPDSPDLVIEPEQVKFSDKSSYALNYTPSEGDKMFLSDPEYMRSRPNLINVTIAVVSAILLIIAVILAYLLIYTPLSQGMGIGEYFTSLFEVAEQSSAISAFKRF